MNHLCVWKTANHFPYVLGHWEFFGLDFDVTPDVLIPRPETELLVEKAIAWLQDSPVRRTVADVGTGSGAIAISIAVNVPDAQILATDISPVALQVAQRNASKFDVDDRVAICTMRPAACHSPKCSPPSSTSICCAPTCPTSRPTRCTACPCMDASQLLPWMAAMTVSISTAG